MKKIALALSISTLVILALTGCQSNSHPTTENPQLKIVTTIFPLYEFAREIGGNNINVSLLLPAGTEAHTFEPTAKDIISLNQADLFITIGAGLEPWSEDLIKGANNPDLITLTAVDYVKLINHGEETDPHIWLNLENSRLIVKTIRDKLIKIDPPNQTKYETNSIRYLDQLLALDLEYKKSLKQCQYNTFITGGHSAYAYLADRYNLKFLSAYGLSPNSEPTPSDLKKISELIKSKGINFIFFEKMISPRISETIANETGAKTLILNPGANLNNSDFQKGVTFIQIMKENLRNLKKALKCQ